MPINLIDRRDYSLKIKIFRTKPIQYFFSQLTKLSVSIHWISMSFQLNIRGLLSYDLSSCWGAFVLHEKPILRYDFVLVNTKITIS